MKINIDICLSANSVAALVIPLFIGISLLSGDIEKRTIYTILSRQIPRSNYLIGRFLGICYLSLIVASMMLTATLCSLYLSSYIYPQFYTSISTIPIILAVMTGFLGTIILNSTVLLWCSVTTSSFLASMLTIATYIIGHTAQDIVNFMNIEHTEVYISQVSGLLVKSILYIFPNFSSFDFKLAAAHGLLATTKNIVLLGLYSLSYSAIILVIAIFFFKKRDLS